MHTLNTPSTSGRTLQVSTPGSDFEDNDLHDSYQTDSEVDVESLKQQQSKIDATLNYLLKADYTRRKPGRPPKVTKSHANGDEVPDSVTKVLKGFTNINELHPGVLLDHLNKLNTFNRKILHNFNLLNDKFVHLSKQFDSLKVNSAESALLTVSAPSSPVSVPPPSVPATDQLLSKNENIDLSLKIDAIEQRTYENVLTLNGADIDEILNQEKNTDVIKTKTIQKIKLVTNEVTESDIEKIVVLGQRKKIIKLTLSSQNSKNKILINARRKRQPNFYFGEFLTVFRNNLFRNARNLKRSYPDRISSVYTRSGNIYYKLANNNNHRQIRHQQDLDELERQIT